MDELTDRSHDVPGTPHSPAPSTNVPQQPSVSSDADADAEHLQEYLEVLGSTTAASLVGYARVGQQGLVAAWSDDSRPGPDVDQLADAAHQRLSGSPGPGPAEWSLAGSPAVSHVVADDGMVLGVVVMAAPPGTSWQDDDLQTLTVTTNLVQRVESGAARRPDARQRRLDDLVTRVATELMSVSAATMRTGLQRIVRVLAEFFAVDTAFLRRNDHVVGASILMAEWPVRENIPDPDPLGVVPFEGSEGNPFLAARDFKEPILIRPSNSPDDYQERVRDGADIPQVSMATVPILHDGVTEGALGFINFGDREWLHDELNALQTIASLLAQLQGRVDAEERLRHHAYHDELTGLPNRRSIIDLLRRRLTDTTAQPFPLFFIDLDRLKALNDYLGHTAGDQMLCAMADRLRNALQPGDTVARLGGDEFVIVFDHPTDASEAVLFAWNLLDIISQPLVLGDHAVARTACIGVAMGVPGEATPEDLVRDADMAMLAAKTNGGNEAMLFSETIRERIEILADMELHLRSAIENGALRLYYQPEYDLRTGSVLSAEALVRWQHPQRGLLGPAHFIEVAESSNIIVELGRWVLREACANMASWRRQFPGLELTVRVNVSPVQLVSNDFVDLVATTLAEQGLPGECLCLEITERGVMRDIERVLSILKEIHDLDVTVAIDDFGTGSSALGKLKELPVDTLKIDQSFVAELGMNRQDQAIVESIVQIARTFHLDVVAEGIETSAAVEELLRLGCHRGQGYLLQRPMTGPAFAELLAQPKASGPPSWRVA